MTDRSKFEQMLESLINEDQETAKELFHQLVVEKSREIYENILAEDFADLEEVKDEDEEQVEEDFGFAEADDEEDKGEIGGDATDDFIDDVESDEEEEAEEMGDEEGDIEDRVVDLEDALDDLRAEFEALLADEKGEEEHADMFGADEMGDEMGDEEEKKENFMREYVEKVAAPKGGDDGANAKSVVAGKNDMGGTTANIAKGSADEKGRAAPTAKEENFGNVNVPGGNAGKTAFKKKETAAKADDGANTKSVVGN